MSIEEMRALLGLGVQVGAADVVAAYAAYVAAQAQASAPTSDWTMPDGSPGYLSIVDFVARFGEAETIAMTARTNAGTIDRPYLIGALQAAQGLVDLNLGTRYLVPLATVPEAIKTAIGDLARARLYPRGAPEGVAGLAKSAESVLLRIATGALLLPLPVGGPPAEAPSATPVLISRGRRAYPNGLDDFR